MAVVTVVALTAIGGPTLCESLVPHGGGHASPMNERGPQLSAFTLSDSRSGAQREVWKSDAWNSNRPFEASPGRNAEAPNMLTN